MVPWLVVKQVDVLRDAVLVEKLVKLLSDARAIVAWRVCATSKAAPSADLARDERELADLRRRLDSKPTDCATTMRSAVGRRLLTRVLILGF
jgi:hypothetical protein